MREQNLPLKSQNVSASSPKHDNVGNVYVSIVAGCIGRGLLHLRNGLIRISTVCSTVCSFMYDGKLHIARERDLRIDTCGSPCQIKADNAELNLYSVPTSLTSNSWCSLKQIREMSIDILLREEIVRLLL